jgi:hypothetical protein
MFTVTLPRARPPYCLRRHTLLLRGCLATVVNKRHIAYSMHVTVSIRRNGSSTRGSGAAKGNDRNYQVTTSVSCICPVCKSNYEYYTVNLAEKLVQCCGTCSGSFHEDCVEFEGELFFWNCCKKYDLFHIMPKRNSTLKYPCVITHCWVMER